MEEERKQETGFGAASFPSFEAQRLLLLLHDTYWMCS